MITITRNDKDEEMIDICSVRKVHGVKKNIVWAVVHNDMLAETGYTLDDLDNQGELVVKLSGKWD